MIDRQVKTKQIYLQIYILREPVHFVAFFFGLTFAIHARFNDTHEYHDYEH